MAVPHRSRRLPRSFQHQAGPGDQQKGRWGDSGTHTVSHFFRRGVRPHWRHMKYGLTCPSRVCAGKNRRTRHDFLVLASVQYVSHTYEINCNLLERRFIFRVVSCANFENAFSLDMANILVGASVLFGLRLGYLPSMFEIFIPPADNPITVTTNHCQVSPYCLYPTFLVGLFCVCRSCVAEPCKSPLASS